MLRNREKNIAATLSCMSSVAYSNCIIPRTWGQKIKEQLLLNFNVDITAGIQENMCCNTGVNPTLFYKDTKAKQKGDVAEGNKTNSWSFCWLLQSASWNMNPLTPSVRIVTADVCTIRQEMHPPAVCICLTLTQYPPQSHSCKQSYFKSCFKCPMKSCSCHWGHEVISSVSLGGICLGVFLAAWGNLHSTVRNISQNCIWAVWTGIWNVIWPLILGNKMVMPHFMGL